MDIVLATASKPNIVLWYFSSEISNSKSIYTLLFVYICIYTDNLYILYTKYMCAIFKNKFIKVFYKHFTVFENKHSKISMT